MKTGNSGEKTGNSGQIEYFMSADLEGKNNKLVGNEWKECLVNLKNIMQNSANY